MERLSHWAGSYIVFLQPLNDQSKPFTDRGHIHSHSFAGGREAYLHSSSAQTGLQTIHTRSYTDTTAQAAGELGLNHWQTTGDN